MSAAAGAILGFYLGQVPDDCGTLVAPGVVHDCVNRLGIDFGSLLWSGSIEETSIGITTAFCTVAFGLIGYLVFDVLLKPS